MPWKIDENNCVVRADTGKQMHCYPKTPEGKADAEKYLKALYANAPEHKHIIIHKAGNMAGLAKHISHLIGSDPDFHAKCTSNPEVQKIASGYDINALCAKAHKLVVGEWPASQTDEGSIGKRAKQKKVVMKFKYHPEWLGK
jgi:hypothetical protein